MGIFAQSAPTVQPLPTPGLLFSSAEVRRISFVIWLIQTGRMGAGDVGIPAEAATRPWDADEIAEWRAMPEGGW